MFNNEFKKLMVEHKEIIDEAYNELGPLEFEVMISKTTKNSRGEFFDYIFAHQSSHDEFMKYHYLSKMRKILENGTNIESYLLGINYAIKIKRNDLAWEFGHNMIDFHSNFTAYAVFFSIPFMTSKLFNLYLNID